MATKISVSAIECKQNNQTFYSTVLNSEDLKEICVITRRKARPQPEREGGGTHPLQYAGPLIIKARAVCLQC